jgi:glucose/arabinose dehydrogenase
MLLALALLVAVLAGPATHQQAAPVVATCDPPWTVPPGDDDCDGFESSRETTLGTLPLVACPVTPIDNDESPDAWPPDFTDDQDVNISDVLSMKPYFNTSVPPSPPRFDLAPGGGVNITDVLAVKPFFPLSCSLPVPGSYTLVPDVTTATFTRMVEFAMIPGQANEAIVVSQKEGVNNARIRRVALDGSFAPTIYGDLTGRVETAGNEQGILSAAFSPDFANDGRLYVYYTSTVCSGGAARCSRLSRFPVVGNAMDTMAETVVIQVDQLPGESNHNGGRVLFGPDGYLYLSIGDGGGGGDPAETGQDNTDFLGSLLRLNVTGQATYSIPAGNPYVGLSGADEVWAHGFRNPWRFSFDAASGALWLADVGQASWEEVEPVTVGGNYGWDCYEGNASYEPAGCPPTGFQFPRAVYSHSEGCSVTGGHVYRGAAMPELYGWYVYGDYCTGRVWALNTGDSTAPVLLVDSTYTIASFAELPDGELIALTFNGNIRRLTRP